MPYQSRRHSRRHPIGIGARDRNPSVKEDAGASLKEILILPPEEQVLHPNLPLDQARKLLEHDPTLLPSLMTNITYPLWELEDPGLVEKIRDDAHTYILDDMEGMARRKGHDSTLIPDAFGYQCAYEALSYWHDVYLTSEGATVTDREMQAVLIESLRYSLIVTEEAKLRVLEAASEIEDLAVELQDINPQLGSIAWSVFSATGEKGKQLSWVVMSAASAIYPDSFIDQMNWVLNKRWTLSKMTIESARDSIVTRLSDMALKSL